MKRFSVLTLCVLFSVLVAQDSQPTDKPTQEEVKQFLIQRCSGSVTFDGMFEGIEKLGPNTLTHLYALVTDIDLELQIRRQIPRAIGEVGDKSAIEKLKELQEDLFLEDEIKNDITFALYTLGETEKIDAFIEQLRQTINHVAQNPPPPEEATPEQVKQQIFIWLMQLKDLTYRVKKYEITCKAYESLNKIRPENTEWYNWACTLSLAGRLDEAIEKLNKAYELKQFINLTAEDVERDGDLKNVREHPGFQELLKKLREGATGTEEVKEEIKEEEVKEEE